VQRIQVRSSPHPNGLSLVANTLVGMGAVVGFGSHESLSFSKNRITKSIKPRRWFTEETEGWLRQPPSNVDLSKAKVFASVDHTWPYRRASFAKTIIVWRDPRDALFSHWKRLVRASRSIDGTHPSFTDMLNAKSLDTNLNPIEHWILYYWMWILNSDSKLVVSFENLKEFPEREILRIGNYLGMEAKMLDLRFLSEFSNYTTSGTSFFGNRRSKQWEEASNERAAFTKISLSCGTLSEKLLSLADLPPNQDETVIPRFKIPELYPLLAQFNQSATILSDRRVAKFSPEDFSGLWVSPDNSNRNIRTNRTVTPPIFASELETKKSFVSILNYRIQFVFERIFWWVIHRRDFHY
jgi:hypothetical protein